MISSSDFRFVNYPNPDSFFAEVNGRPLYVSSEKPDLTTYDDAIYTPAYLTPKERRGCLYDQQLQRIDASCGFRTRKDRMWNTDPQRFDGNLADLPVCDRPLLYLGWIKSHFGHFLLESLPRWWPLANSFGDKVDGFLFQVDRTEYLERPHIKVCLNALGITSDNLVYFDRPTRLRSVVVPEVSYQIASHIYEDYRYLLNRLAVEFGCAATQKTDQPLYLSRTLVTRGERTYIGENQLETYLSEKGVRVVHPQQFPFAEQVRLINEHRHIIGFNGSQMYNILGALEPKRVTILGDKNIFPDWFLISKCYDHEATFANVCRRTDTALSRARRVFLTKIKGTKWIADGFRRHYEVDVDQAVSALSGAGIL